jgi:hypothetical protein
LSITKTLHSGDREHVEDIGKAMRRDVSALLQFPSVHSLHVRLDDETHELLTHRAAAPDCAGNVSKAMRQFILGSVDEGMRVRRAIRPELDIITHKLAALRASARMPGAGVLLEEIDRAVRSIEGKPAKVTTT